MTPPIAVDTKTPFMMPEIGGVSKDLVKSILKELLTEEPELLKEMFRPELEEIKEEMEITNRNHALMKGEVRRIGLLVGTIKPEDEEEKEIMHELKENSLLVKEMKSSASEKRDYERELYEELRTRMSMKNKDIIEFFGFDKKNSTKVTRLMRSLSNKYQDVIYERIPNRKRGFRVRLNR